VPGLSVLMVRTALVYLVAGYAIGAVMLSAPGLHLGRWIAALRPVHLEFLLLGWTVQLAFGVAYWILPRFRAGAERGRTALAWSAFGLLNGGVLAAALGGAMSAGGVTTAGRIAEAMAAAAFALHAWARVKPFGKG
jgi:cbb3-type cytochrome oxidase subunit 1